MSHLWIDPMPPPLAFLHAPKERDPCACPACGAELVDGHVSSAEALCFAFYCARCQTEYGLLQGRVGRD